RAKIKSQRPQHGENCERKIQKMKPTHRRPIGNVKKQPHSHGKHHPPRQCCKQNTNHFQRPKREQKPRGREREGTSDKPIYFRHTSIYRSAKRSTGKCTYTV